MPEDDDQKIACLSCLAENHAAESFCRKCGAPIGATATLDPLKAIHAQGYLFRTALKGRPRFIVLLGIWIMFLPVLVVSVSVALYLISNRSRPSDVVFFWAMAGLSYVSFVVLYKVTRNYFTIPRADKKSADYADFKD